MASISSYHDDTVQYGATGVFNLSKPNPNRFWILQFYAFDLQSWNWYRKTTKTCLGDGFANVDLIAVHEITIKKYDVFILQQVYYILCG